MLYLMLAVTWVALTVKILDTTFCIFGVIGVLLVSFVIRAVDPNLRLFKSSGVNTSDICSAFTYLPWILYQALLSSLHVADILWKAQICIEPYFDATERWKFGSQSKVIIANSITLTPGTISVLVSEDSEAILVHALNEASMSGVQSIQQKVESKVKKRVRNKTLATE